MSRYAPVYIGTMNRFDHFMRAVNSLRTNDLAAETLLYIGLDHPVKEAHFEGYDKIRAFLDNLTGFKDLIVFKREKNLGAVRNFQDGKAQLLEVNDRIIVSEDDNTFAPNFLTYMNLGLEKFETDSRIFSICGYNLPLDIGNGYAANYFLYPGAFVWGYGIWRDRYQKVHVSQQNIARRLRDPLFVLQTGAANPRFLAGMLAIAQGKQIWDPFSEIAIGLHIRQNKLLSVFPTVSKVRNLGHDGTGVRCTSIEGKNIFALQDIDQDSDFAFEDRGERLVEHPIIKKAFKGYFKGNTKSYFRLMNTLLRYYLHAVKK
ncbi:MAG TPA: hypothetical protein PLA08_01175 [Candidatus Cloacimonadota bacterium]|nr:hypothetical protein [Candidatus Cloacimonadota bacterium]